jgi:hypothetical protein
MQRPRGRFLVLNLIKTHLREERSFRAVRLAREHLVGGSGLAKRQHIAYARGQFTGVDQGRNLFEAPG